MKKPRVLVVTRIPFWLLGAGERTRLLALFWVLGAQTELTLLFLGRIGAPALQRLQQLRVNCAVCAVPGAGDPVAERLALSRLCADKGFDFCIFQRIALHYLLDALPPGVRSVLDTHDLESANAESRGAAGVVVDNAISFEDEIAMLARFDRVLLIQAEDQARVAVHLGSRAMLAPHPVWFPARAVDPLQRRLGLVASAWVANLDGLDWFADRVWPRLAVERAEMHLVGWIGERWRPGHTAFRRHGFVADPRQAWGAIDVAVNPVRWGSGLKIKTVEALGHGLPLVTSSEGARGLMAAAGHAFLVADDPHGFAEACAGLLTDPQARARLGAAAHAYAQRHFSPQACFGELLRYLQS